MLKYLFAIALLFVVSATAFGLWICSWDDVVDVTSCSTCADQEECYTYSWQKPKCVFNVFGGCSLGTSMVIKTRRTYWCVLGASGCKCDTNYAHHAGPTIVHQQDTVCIMD